jgi:hypothetical protein
VLHHEAAEEEDVIGNLVSGGFLETSFLSLQEQKWVVIYLGQDSEVPKGYYKVKQQQLREHG